MRAPPNARLVVLASVFACAAGVVGQAVNNTARLAYLTDNPCSLSRFMCKIPGPSCAHGDHHDRRRRLLVSKRSQRKRMDGARSQGADQRNKNRGPCERNLLVTGTAGSGTHFITSYLAYVGASKGTTVRHESPLSRPDVLVR